jgi:hypothetical protein
VEFKPCCPVHVLGSRFASMILVNTRGNRSTSILIKIHHYRAPKLKPLLNLEIKRFAGGHYDYVNDCIKVDDHTSQSKLGRLQLEQVEVFHSASMITI